MKLPKVPYVLHLLVIVELLKTYGYCYKKNRTKKARKLKKKIKLPKHPELIPLLKTKTRKNTIKKFKKIKLPLNKIELKKAVKNITNTNPKMNYAPQFIALFSKLESLMTKKGEHFREVPIPRLKTLLYCMENYS